MMGEQAIKQEALFYGFSLEDHVPAHHLLRSIDRFVERSDIGRHLEPYYSAIGRPSIDPELMIRMLLIGYCCGIRSERRLCEEFHLNLANRWFCRFGLSNAMPDHSTFSKSRHGRFRDSDLLRTLVENTVRLCVSEGIVGGEGFSVDASLIRADAHRQSGVATRQELDPQKASRSCRRISIWLCWTTLPLEGRLTCHRSSSRPPIRLHVGQQRRTVPLATPTATTTSSTSSTPSSWTWSQAQLSARLK